MKRGGVLNGLLQWQRQRRVDLVFDYHHYLVMLL
jgi:hypothetical protein